MSRPNATPYVAVRKRSDPKRFDDASTYEAEIARLVPGHGILREMTIATLRAEQERTGHRIRSMVVAGGGPGAELEALAHAFPGTMIDAYETSVAMANAAEERIGGGQVRIFPRPLPESLAPRFDAAVCLLVAHLIPKGSSRRALWHSLSHALQPGGILAMAEIERCTARSRAVWSEWSRLKGCDDERLKTLDARLGGGFSVLDPAEIKGLAWEAGFRYERTPLRILGVALHIWRKRQDQSSQQSTEQQRAD